MIEIRPPRAQASIIQSGLGEFIATRDGALKMPAPITMPTTIATASRGPRVGRGRPAADGDWVRSVGIDLSGLVSAG